MATATTPRTRKSTATKAVPAKVTNKENAMPAATEEAPKTVAAQQSADAKAVATANAKKPSELHENFKAWLEANGAENVDLETVKLVCSLRHTFQKSEANQAHLANRKSAAEAKLQERATKAAARAAELAKKADELAKKAKAAKK